MERRKHGADAALAIGRGEQKTINSNFDALRLRL
jgi:hypothetical protein